jgi:hypothetical protein
MCFDEDQTPDEARADRRTSPSCPSCAELGRKSPEGESAISPKRNLLQLTSNGNASPKRGIVNRLARKLSVLEFDK